MFEVQMLVLVCRLEIRTDRADLGARRARDVSRRTRDRRGFSPPHIGNQMHHLVSDVRNPRGGEGEAHVRTAVKFRPERGLGGEFADLGEFGLTRRRTD